MEVILRGYLIVLTLLLMYLNVKQGELFSSENCSNM